MEELVSVIIPVYNRQKTISRAIDSVLRQTYKNIEIIVVDDGSCDGTMEILKSYSDAAIQIFSQDHKGACAARNRGIDEAKGVYLAFQDSDDEWMPDKLCKQISYMKQNHFKVCYCPYLLCGSETRTIPDDYHLTDKYEDHIETTLKAGNMIGTPTLVMEKNVLEEIGKFDEDMPRLQDYELIIRIVQRYKIGYYAEALIKAYRQTACISYDNRAYKEAVYQLIKKHGHFLGAEYMQNLFFNVIAVLEENDAAYLRELQKVSGVSMEEIIIGFRDKQYLPLFSLFKWQCRQQYMKFEKKLQAENFTIYGAGKYAKRVFDLLRDKNLKPRSFLVTASTEAGRDIQGIPIENPKDEYKKMPVLIATGMQKQEEIMRYLNQEGFDDYCAYPLFDLE